MPRRPGPRVAESISVVRATLSPTRTPWVSSKICRSARRPWTRNTSPLSCASPTCTKATEFFMIGASLSILTIFPITPMTRASGVEFGILTQSLRDKCFEDGPTALGLQLLPMADDLPASEVKYDGLEGEVVVLSTFLQVRPCNPQHLPVKVQHIPLLEQLLERQDPGEDMAKPEVGLVEVATDVFEPLPDPDRGWAQAVAAANTSRTRGLVTSCMSSPYRFTTVASAAFTNCRLHARMSSSRLISWASSGSSMRKRPWSRSSVIGNRSTSRRGGSAGRLQMSI